MQQTLEIATIILIALGGAGGIVLSLSKRRARARAIHWRYDPVMLIIVLQPADLLHPLGTPGEA